MPYTGQCNCGAVTATFDDEPLAVRQCWCRQCQQIGAGSSAVNAIFRTAGMALTGDLATNDYVAASGNTLVQSFCPLCGTPVMGQSKARPQVAAVRIGFLDEGHGLKPEADIWTSEMPDWVVLDPAIEAYSGHPPPPKSAV